MKTQIVVVLLLMPLITNSVILMGQVHTGDASVLLKMESEFQNATAEDGWNGFLTYFAEEAVELPNGESVMKGKEVIRKSLGEWAPGMSLTWTPSGSGIAASGDLGYTYGEYTFKTRDKDGHPIVRYGKYTTIWKKQSDGTWKIALDMGNNAPAHEAQ